jgi:hypothetical protein
MAQNLPTATGSDINDIDKNNMTRTNKEKIKFTPFPPD